MSPITPFPRIKISANFNITILHILSKHKTPILNKKKRSELCEMNSAENSFTPWFDRGQGNTQGRRQSVCKLRQKPEDWGFYLLPAHQNWCITHRINTWRFLPTSDAFTRASRLSFYFYPRIKTGASWCINNDKTGLSQSSEASRLFTPSFRTRPNTP